MTNMNEINSSSLSFHHSTEDSMSFLENFTSMGSYSVMELLQLNATNATESIDWRDTYKPVLDGLLMLILIVVMLSMGCEITLPNLLSHVRRPIGLFIGIFSQFGIMPASAYCILLISGVTGLHATGVLIISCCPGGVLSNTFTYFCEGDLPLSVAMTCASTVLAMGMMPLNIWLYGKHFESDDLVIPYEKMAMSLISVTSPVIVGMIIKWKLPKIASFIGRLGGFSAILVMFICIGMEIALFPNMFVGVPIKLYVIVLLLPTIGLTLGYGLATLLKRSKPVRKTISIECGVQNVPVALTIIALSFPIEMQEDIVLLPWMYGFAMMSGCSVICLSYHFSKKCRKPKDDIKADVVEKGDPLLENKPDDEAKSAIKIEIKPFIIQNGKHVSEADSFI